ncbi:TetR/AcrR family transcriptional regulator [Streptomyces sp. RS10V-4]|uniref:TetR/AcrR family transcriptional regulator n=1 Tax=Streptomyces rhizoryzae TaxID=2932493 RepID=UPI00200397A8|nr:TetR/AcrR family transcriptional regulator [Streptomyces rhizoryzae]MCK7626012.1 TetR/AcrR family transcriptional regulator [Streptomyces rhizoryzae]
MAGTAEGDGTADEVLVWDRPERGARGPAPERNRGQLTEAAVRLADAGGLAAVSVRQVARELGTGPASLYRYVAGRDDLVDLMVDAATGEIDLGVALTGDPVADLVALAGRTHQVHLRHPWLVEVAPEAMRVGPRGLAYLEYALRALEPLDGLPGAAKLEAVAALNALVVMVSGAVLRARRAPTARQAAQARYLHAVAEGGEHPLLAQALADGTTEEPGGAALAGPGGGPRFARVVRRALTGLLAPDAPGGSGRATAAPPDTGSTAGPAPARPGGSG